VAASVVPGASLTDGARNRSSLDPHLAQKPSAVSHGRQPAGAVPPRVPSMTDSLEVQVLYPAA